LKVSVVVLNNVQSNALFVGSPSQVPTETEKEIEDVNTNKGPQGQLKQLQQMQRPNRPQNIEMKGYLSVAVIVCLEETFTLIL
jgi:hypothetical protein